MREKGVWIKKGGALALVLCVFATELTVPTACAQSIAITEPASPESQQHNYNNIFISAQLPEALGEIKERHAGTSAEAFQGLILIQDAHAVADAQRSLDKILRFLHEKHDLRLVGLEAASGPLDPLLYRSFPQSRILHEVLETYVERGEISGAVKTAITGPEGMTFYGVEDPRLYERDIDAFLESLSQRRLHEKEMNRLQETLGRLKQRYYSPELLELDALLQGFYHGKGGLEPLLHRLAAMAKTTPGLFKAGSYPNLEKVFHEIHALAGPEEAYLTSETRLLTARVRAALKPHSELQEFHQKEQAFETERISRGEFLEYLFLINEKLGLKVPFSEKLAQDAKDYRLLEDMAGEAFFDELSSFNRELKEAMLRSAQERRIENLSHRVALLDKAFRLELSRIEWQEFQKLAAEDSVTAKENDDIAGLEQETAGQAGSMGPGHPVFEFYRLAESREQAMLEKIKEQMKLQKTPVAALVTGGFHSEGFRRLLRDSGVSYLLITPAIDNLPEDTGYLDQMQGRVSWKEYLRPRFGRVGVQEAFAEAMVDKLAGAYEKELRTRGEPSLAYLKTWRDQVLQRLAKTGGLADAGSYTRYLDALRVRGMSPAERDSLREAWKERVQKFVEELTTLHQGGGLSAESMVAAMGRPAAAAWNSVMVLKNGATAPERWMLTRYDAEVALPIPDTVPVIGDAARKPVLKTTPARSEAPAVRRPPEPVLRSGALARLSLLLAASGPAGVLDAGHQTLDPEFPRALRQRVRREAATLAVKTYPVLGHPAVRQAAQRWVRLSSGTEERPALRSELRPTPLLDQHSVVSFQMEAGLPTHFLNWVKENYDEETADLVAQSTVTGGLGALMPDLFEGWKGNETDVTAILPIWEEIKNVPKPRGGLGQYLRAGMEDTGIELSVELTITSRFRAAVLARDSKAKQILDKKIKVRVFREKSTVYGTPHYFLDAYYLKDESAPDTDENRIRIFDEVYNDDNTHPGAQYWRYVHMAIYRQASEKLVLELQARNTLKKDLILVDNEGFVSLPAKRLPGAKRHHMNHTVYLPGMEQPGEVAYELLEFPEWMRPFIVHDGRISIADYVAISYDAITGVGLVEHTPKLGDAIFPAEFHKLKRFREGTVRNTNGVFLPKWQAEERRRLIETTKQELGIDPEVEDREFFEILDQLGDGTRETFQERNEFLAAMSVAKFLLWLRKKQGKTGAADWLHNTFGKYVSAELSPESEEAEILKFISAVRAAAALEGRGERDKAWREIDGKYARLREVLMEDPIVSNVRRQVPYKGPDKWKEDLEFLETPDGKDLAKWGDFLALLARDETALDYFKKNAGRTVIGGRVFAKGALELFQQIKDKVAQLGLQDKITTIENYNIFEAPILFQAMAGVVMIADEDLEASATSMMKGATNFAEIIGVFGGANPEIWKIIETATGREIDALDEQGKPAITHDDLEAKTRSGEWQITNGRLVRYLPYGTGPGEEKSDQDGGRRRPSAESLLFSLFDLKKDYADTVRRRQRQYNVLAASYKVDVRVGQSRAHRMIWEEMLEGIQERDQVLDSIEFDLTDLEKVYTPGSGTFDWRVHGGRVVQQGRPGLAGFLESYRRLRAQGTKSTLGRLAAESLRHHALEQRHNGGSLFPYLKSLVSGLSDGAGPLRTKIDELSVLAAVATDDEEILALNLMAMDYADRYLMQLAGVFFENYMSLSPKQHDLIRRYQALFQNPTLKEMIIRHLDTHPAATRLQTDNAGVAAYRFDRNGDQLIIAINHRAKSTQVKEEPGTEKAWANIQFDAKLRKFWEDLGETGGEHLFQAYELLTDRYYRFYDGSRAKSPIVIGVPQPPGIQVLAFKKIEARIITYLSQTLLSKGAEPVPPLELLTEEIKAALERGENLEEKFSHVAALDRRSAQRLFGENGLPQVMALVTFLAPALLERMASWNRNTYHALKNVTGENTEVFSLGQIAFHKPENAATTLVLSRVLGDEKIVMPVQFSSEHVSLRDSVPKVWTVVTGLGEWDQGLRLKRDADYEPYDLIRHRHYGSFSGSRLLESGWDIGIPVFSKEHQTKASEYPVGFQMIRMGYKRGPRELDQEIRRLNERPQMENLKVAINLKDIGAALQNGKLTYQESLERARRYLRALRDRGAGRVYFYGGLYEMSEMSGQVHRGRPDKRKVNTFSPNGRVVGTVRDYPTKKKTYKDPHTGAFFEHEDDLNPFSILGLNRFNPRLSAAWDRPGSSEESRRMFRELVAEAHALGMTVTVDFIPWLSPDAVNETNYHRTFFKEISPEENEDFRRRDENGKLDFRKDLADRNEGFVTARIADPGVPERVILVRHLQGLYAPNVDQVILNPYLPEVREEYISALKRLSEDGVDEVRIDMAAVYLKEWIQHDRNYFSPEYFWSLNHARPGMVQLLEKEMGENEQPWGLIFSAAKENDPRPEGQKIRFNTEAYDEAQRAKLIELGAEGSYYPDFFKNLIEVSRGKPASYLAGAVQHALDNRGKATIYISNFDQFPWLKASEGVSRRAVQGLVTVLSRLGVEVMVDLRDWMEHSGQLFPIPGGDQHPDKEHDHPFASQAEMEVLLNPDRVMDAIEDAPMTYRIRDIVDLVPAVSSQAPLEYVMLNNSDPSRYITFAWKAGKDEWKMLLADLHPARGGKIDFIQIPGLEHLGGKAADWIAVDPDTGHRIDGNLHRGVVEDVGTYPELPFRILNLRRSELRGGISRSDEFFWRQGKAAAPPDLSSSGYLITSEFLSSYLARIRSRVDAMEDSPDRLAAGRSLDHLESLLTGKTPGVSGVDELRWSDHSFYFGSVSAKRIQIPLGVFADQDFADQFLFTAAAQSFARTQDSGITGDDQDRLAQSVFGKDENTGFWRAYEDFSELSTDRFLFNAIERFEAFEEGHPYFETKKLFSDWLENDIKSQRHPELEQAAFLFRQLWARRDQLEQQMERLGVLKRLVKNSIGTPGFIAEANQRELKELEERVALFYRILYPVISFVMFRDSYFDAVRDIRGYFQTALEKQMREEDDKLPAARKTPEREFAGRVETALRHILKSGRYTYSMEPTAALTIMLPQGSSPEVYKKQHRIHQDFLQRPFKADQDWLVERLKHFDTRNGFHLEGMGVLEHSALERVSMMFSGFRPSGDTIAHLANRHPRDSWTVASHIEEEWVPFPGYSLITSQRALTSQLMAPDENLYYHLDVPGNQLTVQRYRQHFWADILSWIHPQDRTAVSTRDLSFQDLWRTLFSVRKRLSPHAAINRHSYFEPGGLVTARWVQEAMDLQKEAEEAFWGMVRSEHASYADYFESVENPDRNLSARMFWYYTLFTHPRGPLARLAENLKYQEGSQKLTAESSRYLIDALYAIYWSGIPRADRAEGLKPLFSMLLSYIRIHPDGISITDPAAFHQLLTEFVTPQPGPGDAHLSMAAYEDWLVRFIEAHRNVLQDREEQLMPQVQLVRVQEPDASYATLRTRVFGDYSPEIFPAADLLHPERQPWNDVYDQGEKSELFNDREASWTGLYTYRGFQIPGSSFWLRFPDAVEGEVLEVVVREGRLTVSHLSAAPDSGDSRPLLAQADAAERFEEPLLDISLQDFLVPYGQSGKPLDQIWQKIPDFQESEVTLLEESQSLTDDGFYRVSARRGDLVPVPLAEGGRFYHIPSLRGEAQVLIHKTGQVLSFYSGTAEHAVLLGSVRLPRFTGAFPGYAGTVEALPDLLPEVVGLNPQSTVRYLALNTLAAQFQDAMKTGRGYTAIDLIPGEGDTVLLNQESAAVLVSEALVNRPAEALAKLLEALRREDPVYQIIQHRQTLVSFWKGDTAFSDAVVLPPLPERLSEEILSSWQESRREAYQSEYAAAVELHRKLRVARRMEAYRNTNRKTLGNIGGENKFRQLTRRVLEAVPAGDDTDFLFKGRDGSEFSSVGSLIKSGAKFVNEGIGAAAASYFVYRQDARFVVRSKAYYELSPPSGESETRYLFIRYKESVLMNVPGGTQERQEVPIVILFDFETGEELLDEQFSFTQKSEKVTELKHEIISDARKAASRLNLDYVKVLLEEFLGRFEAGPAIQMLDRQIEVLGHLKLILPAVLDSQSYVPELNYVVLRMIFEDILKSGPEGAPVRSGDLVRALSQNPKRALLNIQFFLDVHSQELGLDVERVFKPSEGDTERAAAVEQFYDFSEAVLLDAVVNPGASTSRWTEEDFIETLTQNAIGIRGHIHTVLDRHPGLGSGDGRRWVEPEIAQRYGLIQRLEEAPTAPQAYFIREYYQLRHEAEAETSRELARAREEAERQVVSAEEVRVRATAITPYGGVQGIGASAALVEYQGKGQSEKDLLLVDFGAYLDNRYSPPKAPRRLEDFHGKLHGLFLTHGHLDHIGAAVSFWRDVLKKQVPVYLPAASYELIRMALGYQADSMESLPGGARSRNRFSRAEAEEFMKQAIPLEPGRWYQISEKMKVYYHAPVGHLHGAASLVVSTPDSNTFLSGDVSISRQGPVPGYAPLPDEIASRIDQAQIESTYGMETRGSEEEQEKRLAEAVRTALKNPGGRVLLPAFANGRSQRVLLLLLQNFQALRAAAGGNLKIYIDGQAAAYTTQYLKWYPEVFAPYRSILEDQVVIIDTNDPVSRGRLRTEALERDANQKTIIIASAGNASQGRSLFWATRFVNDANAAIFFTGYMDPQEAGSRLLAASQDGAAEFDFREEVNPGVLQSRVDSLLRSETIEDQHVGELLEPLRESLRLGSLPLLAKIQEFKLSGHASGKEIVQQILEPMTSLRQVMIGHGSIDRSRQVKNWIQGRHPQWHPVILQTRQRREGMIPGLLPGLEDRRAFFEGLEAQPVPRPVIAAALPAVEPVTEAVPAEESKIEETVPAPQFPPLELEKGKLTKASRRELLGRRLAEKADLTVEEARAWLVEAVQLAGKEASAGQFGETTVRTDLKDLRSRPSELRVVVRPVLETLAGFSAVRREQALAAAVRFLDAVDGIAFDRVAYALETEAELNPVYAGLYAPQTSGDGMLSLLDALKRLGEKHPDHEERFAAFVPLMIPALEDHFNDFLKNADHSLDFSFAFQPQGSEKAYAWLGAYVGMVERLKSRDPVRVRGDIEILITPEEKASLALDFRQKIDASKVAHFFELHDNSLTTLRLDDYLKKNEKALVYGFSDVIESGRYPGRLVKSFAGVEHTLPVALVLTSLLAQDGAHALTAELLKQIPEWLPEIVTFTNGRLEVTELALELMYRFEVSELIASMA